MFHNVLTVEYMLKMRKYTNANYMAGIFVNVALFLGCMIVSFMRIAYLQINDGSVVVQWAQNRFFLLITIIQVPALQRMVSLFLWQTFCPLVVIFCSKLYQRFAVKRMKRLTENLEDLLTSAVTKVSASVSTEAKDTRLDKIITGNRYESLGSWCDLGN